MKKNSRTATTPQSDRTRRWKRILILAAGLLVLGACAGSLWIADQMALSFLTGQRRVPGQDWFGHPVRAEGPVPGYAFLGYSEPSLDPPGFRITRAADEGLTAGLRAGDLVRSIDGRVFQSSFDLISALLADHQAGDRVRVEFVREAATREIDLELRPFLRSPADLGLDFEEIQLESSSGFQLRGWYIPGPLRPREKVLVFVHGAKASRFQALDSVLAWHGRGYSVVAMDLSGRGASAGEYVTYSRNERMDVCSTIDWLAGERGVSPSQVVLFGTSNGAASAIFAAAELPGLAGLILDAPYSDLWQEAQEMLRARGLPGPLAGLLGWAVWRRTGVEIAGIRPLEVIDRVEAPTLLVHGESDSQVLPYHSELLHEKRIALGRVSRRWVIPGGEHGFDNYPADFWERLADFADESLGSR